MHMTNFLYSLKIDNHDLKEEEMLVKYDSKLILIYDDMMITKVDGEVALMMMMV